jgi:hypothetical protein
MKMGVHAEVGGLKAVPLGLGTSCRGRCDLIHSSIHELHRPLLAYPSGVIYSIVLKKNSMVLLHVSLVLEME